MHNQGTNAPSPGVCVHHESAATRRPRRLLVVAARPQRLGYEMPDRLWLLKPSRPAVGGRLDTASYCRKIVWTLNEVARWEEEVADQSAFERVASRLFLRIQPCSNRSLKHEDRGVRPVRACSSQTNQLIDKREDPSLIEVRGAERVDAVHPRVYGAITRRSAAPASRLGER